MHKINHANIKEWAANYQGEPFDAILCDPPYELGFMGKSWDSSGIAFDKDMWADLLRILKPGGHLLAFSGSRTYHRMAVAIEDAGFEIRDMIEWVYGSGFPKSLNIGKAVDKIQGNEREVTGIKEQPLMTNHYGKGLHNERPIKELEETKGTSPYEGYGTALKPAHEPCVLARKPIEGTVANNVLKHGTGGLNIDGTRIEGTDEVPTFTRDLSQAHGNKFGAGTKVPTKSNGFTGMGRFPANLIHDGSDEVEAVFPNVKGATSRTPSNATGVTNFSAGNNLNIYKDNTTSASRFFYTAKLTQEELNDTTRGNNAIQDGDKDPIEQPQLPEEQSGVRLGDSINAETPRLYYTAKASKSERNAGLEEFDGKEAPYKYGSIKKSEGRTGINTPQSNYHPTVKPLSLTKYLATLIKPPTGGRLLVPFSGSGSEMIGALQAGWEYVEGVELTEEYIPIAEARIKYWLAQKDKESQNEQTSML